MTVTDLITRSLQDLNLTDGQSAANPDDVQLAFERLNDFVDDQKNDGLTVYTTTRTTWTLTPNVSSYTVGSGATISIDRPVSPQGITNIGFIDTSLTDPLEIQLGPVLTEDEYASIPLKTLTNPYPLSFYYNPTYASGFGTLRPFPIPTASSLSGVLYTPTPVSEFTSLTQTILLPPGYRRYFRNQLTIEIASAFEKKPPPTVIAARDESLAKLKRTNTRMVDLQVPAWTPGMLGAAVYDIWSDR